MTDEEFAQVLTLSHEISGVEFKGPGGRSDRQMGVLQQRQGAVFAVPLYWGRELRYGCIVPRTVLSVLL